MPAPVFYILSGIMILFGILVVLNRNPVSSALCLVVCFLGLAALFVSLNAYFLGVIQILVYAGAVMVLFLFIIMLMDLKAEEGRSLNMAAVGGGMVLILVFVAQLLSVLGQFDEGEAILNDHPIDTAAALAARSNQDDSIATDLKNGIVPDVKLIGETFFSNFPFHLQVVGVLLLVSSVGVIVLSKRALK